MKRKKTTYLFTRINGKIKKKKITWSRFFKPRIYDLTAKKKELK